MSDAFVLRGEKNLNECQPNTKRQKSQTQQMSNDNGGGNLVRLHLKFHGKYDGSNF
jgi:hypothetical protein